MTSENRIKLWVLPPCFGVPNASPFVLKLQTWLRMANIPHDTKILSGPPKSKTKKVPYIEDLDGTLIPDSSVIIKRLSDRHSVNLDEHLRAEQAAISVLIQRLLEDHLYWALVITRWGLDDIWPHSREAYFKKGLPAPLYLFVPSIIRRQVLRDAWGQGMGRMPHSQVWARATEDLQALSTLLGDKAFFHGEPSTIDATVFAWLANIWIPEGATPIKEAMEAFPNLIAYVDGMKAKFWADWDKAIQ